MYAKLSGDFLVNIYSSLEKSYRGKKMNLSSLVHRMGKILPLVELRGGTTLLLFSLHFATSVTAGPLQHMSAFLSLPGTHDCPLAFPQPEAGFQARKLFSRFWLA